MYDLSGFDVLEGYDEAIRVSPEGHLGDFLMHLKWLLTFLEHF